MPAIHRRRIVGDKDIQEAEQSEFAAEDEGQELNFAEDNVLPEGEENDPVQEKAFHKSNNFNEDEETSNEEEEADMEGVVIRRMEDGTTQIIFSGEQSEVNAKLLQNIENKLKLSRKSEIIDFEVNRRYKYKS